MPSTRTVERPSDALRVANRYLRYERPLSALLTVFVATAFLVTYAATSLAVGVVVGAVLLIAVRAPIIRSRGLVRLETDDDAGAVVDSFTGPTPPVLVFQWGIADEVTTDGDETTYHISYLFGRRSVAMTVGSRVETRADGERVVEITAAVDDRPWATYTATISGGEGRTVVEYEYAADRRFGLRRLPQRIVARRYRDEALGVQGYAVVERDERYGVRDASV